MITTSSIITDRVQSGSLRKIREEHTDHLGNKFFRDYTCAPSFDVDAELLAGIVVIDSGLISEEIAEAVKEYETGDDPLHYEASPSNWQKITPKYQTWDELAAPVLIDFLGRDDRDELRFIESTVIRISTNDKKALLGMTNTEVNNINSDIQLAIDAKASRDLYSPHFNDGVKV